MVGAFVSYYSITRWGLNGWLMKVFPGLNPTLGGGIGAITVILLSTVNSVISLNIYLNLMIAHNLHLTT